VGIEAIELDREADPAPQEVHLVALDVHVALGLLDAPLFLEVQEPVLQG
jgi:hypothetical protein